MRRTPMIDACINRLHTLRVLRAGVERRATYNATLLPVHVATTRHIKRPTQYYSTFFRYPCIHLITDPRNLHSPGYINYVSTIIIVIIVIIMI